MSKRFYVLFSLKQLFQPRLFKTRATVQKYLRQNTHLEFRQFTQEQDAQAFFQQVEAETNRTLRGEQEKDREGNEKDREGNEKDREGNEKDREGNEKDIEGNYGQAEEKRAYFGEGQDMPSQTKELDREEKDLSLVINPMDHQAKEGEGMSKRIANDIPAQSRNLDLEEEGKDKEEEEEEEEEEDRCSETYDIEEEKTAEEAMSKDDILKEIMESISRMEQQLNAPPLKGRFQQQDVQSSPVKNREAVEAVEDTDCSAKGGLPSEEGEGQKPGQWRWVDIKNQKEQRMRIKQQLQKEQDLQQEKDGQQKKEDLRQEKDGSQKEEEDGQQQEKEIMMDQDIKQVHVHRGKESTQQAEAAVSGQEIKEESQEKGKTETMTEQVNEHANEQVVKVQSPPTIPLQQRESSIEQEAEGSKEVKEVKGMDGKATAKAGTLPQSQTSHNKATQEKHSIKTQQFTQTKQMIRKQQLEMSQVKKIDEEQTRAARWEEPLQVQLPLPFLPSESEITPTIHQSQQEQVVPLCNFDNIDYLDYSKEPPLSLRPISLYSLFLHSKLYQIFNSAKATTAVAAGEGKLTISCRQNQNPGLSIAEYQLVTPSGTIKSVELLGVKVRAHAEELALRKGLELASLHKVKVVEVESDLKGTLRERESMLKGGECRLPMDRHLRKMKDSVLEAGLSFSSIHYL